MGLFCYEGTDEPPVPTLSNCLGTSMPDELSVSDWCCRVCLPFVRRQREHSLPAAAHPYSSANHASVLTLGCCGVTLYVVANRSIPVAIRKFDRAEVQIGCPAAKR